MSLQDPRAVLAQLHQKILVAIWPIFWSLQIFRNYKMWTILPTQCSQYKLSIMQFSENLHWDFTTWDSTIQLLKVKFEDCHTKNMFNVERTKISNLWFCAFPLNKYYSYPLLQKLFAGFLLLFLTLFVGHCGGLPNIFCTTIPHFSRSHYQSVKFIIPPLCIICDMWWRYYKFQ